ncbi:mannitol dehydrogenase family protein [Marinomonas epiphytica]
MKIQTTRSNYNKDDVKVGIVHIGLGAFHRAHQAMYVEKNLNRHQGGDWGICSVNIRSNFTLVDQLNEQNGRYFIAEYESKESAHLREINAIKQALFAKHDKAALFSQLTCEEVKIVTLTVTEKGYYLSPSDMKLLSDDEQIQHDIQHPSSPNTAPGIIVEALHRRRELGLAPFAVLSCDNIPNNGQLTRSAVCELAAFRSIEFAQWIQANVAFPSSMVDRIVPAMTDKSLQRIKQDLNCNDPNAVMCESFSQWVVEDNFPQGRPDWELDGVQMVADVHPFETMKLRLLNGSHSLLAYVGLAHKYETVAQAIVEPSIAQLLRHYMHFEASPTLSLPAGINVGNYIDTLIKRFSNDSLQHRLEQIAMDGSQKMPQRWLAGAITQLSDDETVPMIALGIAAWFVYLKDANQVGHYRVNDPLAETFNTYFEQATVVSDLIPLLLSNEKVFPLEIRSNEQLKTAVIEAYLAITENTMNEYLAQTNYSATQIGG